MLGDYPKCRSCLKILKNIVLNGHLISRSDPQMTQMDADVKPGIFTTEDTECTERNISEESANYGVESRRNPLTAGFTSVFSVNSVMKMLLCVQIVQNGFGVVPSVPDGGSELLSQSESATPEGVLHKVCPK